MVLKKGSAVLILMISISVWYNTIIDDGQFYQVSSTVYLNILRLKNW